MQRYKKVKIVGKGSLGYAVLVESKKSKKQYIMKIIDISKMEEKQIEKALMEVQLLKIMSYPYVVAYRESFMENMCLCIVMDYCEGGDMFHKIARQKELGTPFPEHQIITWLVQMALALNSVHDKNILYRDLKIQNIFFSSKGDIKIGDFGIACGLQLTYDSSNKAIGTPYYLSPVIFQQKPSNQKSNIWSLGCIFYEIATLNHAFDAQNMKGLIQKVSKGTYPPLPQVYSPDLKKLLSKMLIKDPNKRPSIKKILEMPFIKTKVYQLFSNTIKIHELKLEKQNAINKMDLLCFDKLKQEKNSKEKVLTMLQKKKERSKEKKTQVVSTNSLRLGFRKKNQTPQGSKQQKILPKRVPLKQDVGTSKRFRKDQLSGDKHTKKQIHEKSVHEEEQTLEELAEGLLLRNMKRCIKGEYLPEEQSGWKQQK